jgi:hypothetical protein
MQIMTPEELAEFDRAWESKGGYPRGDGILPLPARKAETPRRFIDQALHWKETPQGHAYWAQLANQLNGRLVDAQRAG